MKWSHWWIATVLCLTGGAFAYTNFGKIDRIGPKGAYPDASISPGLIGTTSLEALMQTNPTYSQKYRDVPDAVKQFVKQQYGCKGKTEIDHILPLSIGGSNDVKNLWCEPEHVYDDNERDWGYKTKDVLEAYMAREMKKGTFTVKQAQDCFLLDWVACYQSHLSIQFGSVNPYEEDTDDEVEIISQ